MKNIVSIAHFGQLYINLYMTAEHLRAMESRKDEWAVDENSIYCLPPFSSNPTL
jgi:hypothetical protein